MSEQKLNIELPEDCLKILKACLEGCNKKGAMSLDDAFYVNLSLRTLDKYVSDAKDHKCPEVENNN